MLENRSFDHMLGMLKKKITEINGCLPNQAGCSNHVKANDETSASFTVNADAVYRQADPSHSVGGTKQQIYGVSGSTVRTMDGFIESYSNNFEDKDGSSIMTCFSEEHVPVISTLANEFSLFDGYFASVPGPTEPNRAYAISASSHGMCTNDDELMIRGLPQKTIFRQIEEMGLDYNIYMEQVPAALMFKDVRHKDARKRYHFLNKFYEHAANGNLPEYSWIEPAYFDMPATNKLASDQHPDHDVSAGDQLIKNIYESLRSSPKWNDTALIITYDEHGGFFDHVPPPENIPNPDGLNCSEFNFDRQGIRVPFLVVSPWVKKGTIIHAKDSTVGQYEHSSIVSTVIHKLFKSKVKLPFLQPNYLTKRDEWAATFEHVFNDLLIPRTDCIEKLPDVPSHRLLYPSTLPNYPGSIAMNEFQKNLGIIFIK